MLLAWRRMTFASRRLFCAVLGLVSASAVALACGSFHAEPAGADEAGAPDGSDAAAGDSEVPSPACDPSKVTTDPFHCGACGHSCLGGTCAGGTCAPLLLGQSTGEAVVDVAVDAQRVLWLTSTGPWSGAGHVYACSKNGCGAAGPTVLSGAGDAPGNLTGDGKTAFFSSVYSNRRIVQVLPAGNVAIVGKPHPAAVRLQIRDDALVFASLYGGEPLTDAGFAVSVFRTKELGLETTLASFGSAVNYASMVAASGRLFFGTYDHIAACAEGACSGPPALFVKGVRGVRSLSSDGTSLFWLAIETGDLWSCPVGAPAPCVPQLVIAPLAGGRKLVTMTSAGDSLYMASDAGDIYTCRASSCADSLRLLAHEDRLFTGSEAAFGCALAADDRAVYWAAVDGKGALADGGAEDVTGLTHRLMKLAK